jgi:2-polyprenyl-6-hydroxyphenyl methylase/3-demethylubiquinone-9 3-methyltransferase
MTLRWKIAQVLEIWWWRRYLKGKEIVEYLAAKKAYWKRILKMLQIEVPVQVQILDAGCGPAGIFMILNECRVDAVDPLVNNYEQNLVHFVKSDYPNVQFYHQSLENLTIQKKYDLVFCMNAINHVSDLHLCLNKLIAATVPDGQLILAVDVHKYSFLKRIFRLFPGDVLHPQQHDLQDYRKMLEARDCKIVKTVVLKSARIFNYVGIITKRM